MKKVINYKWRNRIEEITDSDHRIGTDILLIEDVDALRANSVMKDRPYKIDMTFAVIIDKGEVLFKIGVRQYHLKAPAVMIMMAGQVFELIWYSDDLMGRAIVMSNLFVDPLFAGADSRLTHRLYSSMIDRQIKNLETDQNIFSQYYQLLLNIVQSPNSEFKIEAARHLTLSMFYGYSYIKHNITTPNHVTSRQDDIYRSFLNVVEKNFGKHRDVAFYADTLCLSPKHLSQVVKVVSGKTAADIIEDYVITEVKALLLNTTMTIQQISDTLNFPSQSVFGKYFKRIMGMSPNEYRNK